MAPEDGHLKAKLMKGSMPTGDGRHEGKNGEISKVQHARSGPGSLNPKSIKDCNHEGLPIVISLSFWAPNSK